MNKRWGIIGCGWLGITLAKHLIENGDEVIGSTTSSNKLKTLREKGITPVKLSIEKEETNKFNACHYILLSIPPSNLKEDYAKALKRLIGQFNPTTKVIFISSTSVYANKNQTATEQDELDGEGRNAPYIIKAEKVLREKLKQRLTIIRMAGLVGGERHPVKYMSGKSYAHGLNKINLIHLDDCVGLITAVVKQNFFGEIINGCATEHPDKQEYYTWAAKQLNIAPPTFENKEGSWKKISNNKSINMLNYSYEYTSPYDFPL